jgi:tetratricopeptide (TPR) repeat protein
VATMKKVLIILCVLFLSITGKAEQASPEILMEKANQAYSATDYPGAINLYDSVLSSGYESAVLYFNLGNAHFKMSDIPSAILYYEKAKKLDPTDEDIMFNLDLANSRIIDKMEPLPEFFLKTWLRSVRDILSSNQWAKLMIVFFILALLSIGIFIISRAVIIRKISFWINMVSIVLVVASLIFSLNGYHEYKRHSSAIIFTPTVTVKSSPSENSVDLFVIHEGTKVFISDQVEGWSEVRLANGNVGWIETNTYKNI